MPLPSRLQATKGELGSSIFPPWRFAALVQSSRPNFVLRSALTPVGNVGVTAAGVEAFGVGVAFAPGFGTVTVVVEVDDVEVVFALAAPTAYTWRKRSSAVWPTRSTIRVPVSPGTEITIC